MITGSELKKGYDDTRHLKRMSSGIVDRTWTSVDEAARAVLGETAGSNVDRLRRKYREQNWHERGLADYVDAEIARRGLVKPPGWLKAAARLREACLSPLHTVAKAGFSIRGKFHGGTPTSSLVVFSLGSTLLFSAAAAGAVPMNHAMAAVVACCLLVLAIWADKTSVRAESRSACLHLFGLAALTAAVVAAFALADPSDVYSFGSSQGTLAAAAGMTMTGLYATSYIGIRTRRSGTRNTPEVGSLIAAIALLSQVGTAVMIHDVATTLSLID